MSDRGGQSWYPQTWTSDSSNASGNTNVFRQAQPLLGSYPFASATPSTHVARHLSNLTITAAPPSYIQPSLYTAGRYNGYGTDCMQENEMSLLAAQSAPQGGRERQLWDASREDAIRLLNDQTAPAYSYYQTPPSRWNPSPTPSTYHPSAFAQSVIQHVAPYNAYPTPPPPTFSASSSSLANALGGSVPEVKEKKPIEYSRTESKAFFEEFLSKTSKEIDEKPRTAAVAVPSTPPSKPALPQSSPDPLRMGASSPLTPLPSQLTPMKRKVLEVVIDTPSKRPFKSDRQSSLPITPRASSSSMPRKPDSSFSVRSLPPKMQMFVEITPPGKNGVSPSHSRGLGTHSDLGGYGSEDEQEYLKRREMMSGVRSSGKRTGNRDDRVPLEKFLNLLEDVYEAEDNVAPDCASSELPGEFFSHLSGDSAHLFLAPTLIRKLIKYVGRIAHPMKRQRMRDPNIGSPRRSVGMAEIEVNTLSRILKVLERSVKAGEDLDPFPSVSMPSGDDEDHGASPTKHKSHKAKGGEANRSKSPQGSTKAGDSMATGSDLTQEDFDKLERTLEISRDCMLAADCCIAILTSDRLTKQLYSEDLITACLSAVKTQLTKVIYPFVEVPPAGARTDASPLLLHVARRSTGSTGHIDTTAHRQLIGEIFQTLSSVLPRITSLVCTGAESVAMSDAIVIQAVYISIGPFFVVDSVEETEGKGKKSDSSSVLAKTLGTSAMRGLRLEAMSLIRGIFANYVDQRSWIIEEILSSLIKLSESKQKAGQFRLRNGQSIKTVSALLLQLVQTSAHNVRGEARRIARNRQQQAALRRQDSAMNVDEPFLDEHDTDEVRLYSTSLDASTKAAKSIVLFLTQRSGKTKTTKNSNEAEYRAIFDNLVSDLLTVLFWPEWPAASLVLSIVCKFMISSLDDVKSASQNDNNASKTMALEHLGVIAGRLRSNTLKAGLPSCPGDDGEPLKPLEEISNPVDLQSLEKLIASHREVSTHLSKRSLEDQSYESAQELTAAMWGQELSTAISQCESMVAGEQSGSVQEKALNFGKKVLIALHDIWRDAPADVFDNTSQEEFAHVDRLSEQLGTTQILRNAFDPILNVILVALDAPPVFMRTKALRALSQVLTADAKILSIQSVRRAIESHLLDSSPQVRDAAVELIGKYMVDSPAVASDYYQKIADRIADTGLAVRKRVIKLLRTFFTVTNDLNRRIDICTRLVLRMLDEDDSVKDLAIKTIEELWFPPASGISGSTKGQGHNESNMHHALVTVTVIMGVSGNFKDRQSPLEQVLHKIVSSKEGAELSAIHSRYVELCDAMIDGLVDASEFMNFNVINCIKTVHLFASAYPPIISGGKASTLLSYLKNPTTAEEQATSDFILKIYRIVMPHMPKTSAKFGNDLQLILQPMVVKPNAAAGLPALQETVACLCCVVQHLTHDFKRLAALLKSCNARVQQFIRRPPNASLSPPDLRALTMLVYIISLLGEHSGFDQARTQWPDIAPDLDSISKGPIITHIYLTILALYHKYDDNGLRGRLLQCLGFLFRAQPTLMTLESSADVMDAIFASPEEENRGRLLKLLQDFLVAESTKHTEHEKASTKQKAANVDIDELVGNTHAFADSGVSSAIVQRYLGHILDAALSDQPQVQHSAVDILTFTIKQGLAHPIQSFPVIIALETSPNVTLSSRATALHVHLHQKHSSLLNAGFVDAAKASHAYQIKIAEGPVLGYRLQPTPVAMLNRWYALVREKRAARQEFLKAILKVFEVDDMRKTRQADVDFVRYMVENMSSIDYRTQEEVLTVIKYLTSILSTSGMQLLEILSPGHLLSQLQASSAPAEQGLSTDEATLNPPVESSNTQRTELSQLSFVDQQAYARTSVIIGSLMLMKAHMKLMYGLTEDKCSKFVLGKKSAVGDRPAARRKDVPITWGRMPYASKPILTVEDVEEQKQTFLVIWSEDGAVAEPENDEFE